MSNLDGYPANWKKVSLQVRESAGWRCVRCGHLNERPGQHVPCDDGCDLLRHPEACHLVEFLGEELGKHMHLDEDGLWPEQRQRMLTVHHLNGDKQDVAWFNLAPLCQVCHLQIQAKVNMDRPWTMGHSLWFRPYVAGHYARKYLEEILTEAEVGDRLAELLELERMAW